MTRPLLGLLVMLALPGAAAGRVLDIGPGQTYPSLAAAERAAQPGDILQLSPGEHAECAVIRQSGLTIQGSGTAQDTALSGVACAGKAALVTIGADITVRSLTLSHIRVTDRNGAGIRAEGANLTVDHVRFIDNEDGILSASNPDSTIIVRDSVFLQNGVCSPVCAHGIYANHIKLLRVERSRFFETKQGHHIKSRAARTEVIDCDLQDGPNGRSSYQIELPNGGALLVRGNVLEKGPKSENHGRVIVIGAEGVTQPTSEIIIEGNQFTLDAPFTTVFVHNMTATPAQLIGNTLPRGVTALVGAGAVN